MIWRYIIAWFLFIPVAIANGSFREFVYKPLVGDLNAHWLSTVLFLILLSLYLRLLGKWWRIESAGQSWCIGTFWLGLTVLFEFGFGHYVVGHPWVKLLHDYNITEGRVWIFALIGLFVGPRTSYGYFSRVAQR